MRERARRIVQEAVERGSGNFVEEVAAELPLQAIADLLGVPQEDRRKLFDWSNQMLANEDPDFEGESDVAAAEILGYAMAMAAERKENPRDDLVTKLINADKDGRGLNDDEFGYFVIMLTVAGNETTRNAITHGMNAFLDHPDQWQLWLDERPETMVDEVIRWATPINVFQRTALNDVEVGGVPVKKGQRVGLFYGSANYDEDVFAEPYTFDITRSPNPHAGLRRARRALLHRRQPGPPGGPADLRRPGRPRAGHQQARRGPPAPARLGQRHQGAAGQVRLGTRRTSRQAARSVSTSGPSVGDGDGVLHVRAAGAVGAAQRPAVGVGEDLVGGLEEPRLDRDHQPRLELEAAARAAVVRDVRVAVHGPADAVAAELQVHPEPGRPRDVADRGGDVEEPVADAAPGRSRPRALGRRRR